MKKRGQVSIEFVITVGFALLMIIPLTIVLYEHITKTNEGIYNNQAGLIARKIADSANSVYYIGHPTTKTLDVYMPEHIDLINITGREIIFKLSTGQEIVSMSNVNLTGSLLPASGRRRIKISALENMVNISEDAS
ncbi:MAG: hypothetical protein KAK00_10120 [Nanoarchaeota archaeon]|nr:hypothetical protein [Nanoarchaeota archaeon]